MPKHRLHRDLRQSAGRVDQAVQERGWHGWTAHGEVGVQVGGVLLSGATHHWDVSSPLSVTRLALPLCENLTTLPLIRLTTPPGHTHWMLVDSIFTSMTAIFLSEKTRARPSRPCTLRFVCNFVGNVGEVCRCWVPGDNCHSVLLEYRAALMNPSRCSQSPHSSDEQLAFLFVYCRIFLGVQRDVFYAQGRGKQTRYGVRPGCGRGRLRDDVRG